jgi:hypothetical protein
MVDLKQDFEAARFFTAPRGEKQRALEPISYPIIIQTESHVTRLVPLCCTDGKCPEICLLSNLGAYWSLADNGKLEISHT